MSSAFSNGAQPIVADLATCAENRAPILIGVGAGLLSLATIFVVARVYVRAVMVKLFWWDDVTIIFALLFAATHYALDLKAIQYGLGHHVSCVATSQAILARKYIFLSLKFTNASSLFSRLSIVILILRLFGITRPRRMVMYILMISITLVAIAGFIVSVAACNPITKTWNPGLPGKCWSHRVSLIVGYLNGALAALCDMAVVMLSFFYIWRLQMNPRTKVGIWLMMSLGLFTAGTAIARTVTADKLFRPDDLWWIIEQQVAGVLEMQVCIIAASMAPLRPLFRYFCSKRCNEQSGDEQVIPQFGDLRDQFHLHYHQNGYCHHQSRRIPDDLEPGDDDIREFRKDRVVHHEHIRLERPKSVVSVSNGISGLFRVESLLNSPTAIPDSPYRDRSWSRDQRADVGISPDADAGADVEAASRRDDGRGRGHARPLLTSQARRGSDNGELSSSSSSSSGSPERGRSRTGRPRNSRSRI